jgi:two-component system response regulator MprA
MARRILVADDEKAVRDMLRDVLASEGYEVDSVGDGIQVMETLKTKNYDLLILDVGMPGFDGYHVAEQISSKEGYRAKIVILTGRDIAMDSSQALLSGADAFLEKACGIDMLLKTVEKMIGPAELPQNP